ncbi:transposase [Paenisporosarcina sp. NPDC076898]|uniref:transposase n=1 Tax=unclassified Paenisporosarcina TaxID=2642018 RepID=UPI003CFEE6AC
MKPHVIPGRKLEDLRTYYQEHPHCMDFQPVAVVIRLAKAYHIFIKAFHPSAIRIANYFHVNWYETEALQLIRKDVQKDLSRIARQQSHFFKGRKAFS